MDEKNSDERGQANLPDADSCAQRGSQAPEQSAPPEGEPDPGRPLPAEGYALRISPVRIIVLSILTSGVYALYWLYQTWKQLQAETGDVHYPVWHALTLFVPVYGLFRIHRHMSVIQELGRKQGIEALMPPALGVTMMALYWLIVLVSGNQTELLNMLLLAVIRLALVTTLMVRAQSTLNAYWSSVHGSRAVRLPLGSDELRFILAVLGVQVALQLLLFRNSGAAA